MNEGYVDQVERERDQAREALQGALYHLEDVGIADDDAVARARKVIRTALNLPLNDRSPAE